jgi:hypothetical protein
MLKFKYLIIVLLYSNGLFGNPINSIDINEMSKSWGYKEIEIDISAQSAEGRETGVFLNTKKEIVATKVEYYGENGKAVHYVLFDDEKNIIIKIVYGYNIPMYMDGSKIISKKEEIYLIGYLNTYNYSSLNKEDILELQDINKISNIICKQSTFLCKKRTLK